MSCFFVDLIYIALLLITLPSFAWKSWRTGNYRKGLWVRLTGRVPIFQSDRPRIWFHAVSVGEVNLLATLIDQIEREIPESELVISTTTDTGMALAKKKYAPRPVIYCPLDFSWAVRNALNRIQPDLLVLAELELWPNLITIAKKGGSKVAIVNARLSDNSFRGYQRIQPFVRCLLRKMDAIAAQNAEYAERFQLLGAPAKAIHVTGSLKFDGAQTDRNNPTIRQLAALAGIESDDIVFVAGSSQDPEEELALETFRELSAEHASLRLVLVPRHPERFDAVARMLDRSGIPWQRRSVLNYGVPANAEFRVLLVDTVGELWAWWGTAHVAYVGGSMGSRGGQNMIEPAAYGTVVSFGPSTKNFRDVVSAMLASDAAVVVNDGNELTAFVRRAIEDTDFAEQHGRSARDLVARQLGATVRTVHLLKALLDPSTNSRNIRRVDRNHGQLPIITDSTASHCEPDTPVVESPPLTSL